MSGNGKKTKHTWKKILPIAILIIAAVALVAPVAAYGGFMVNVATVNFSETTGSLTATTPQSSVASVPVYNYMITKINGPISTTDRGTPGANVAKITMELKLTTPSGQNVTVAIRNIQGGVGTRDHTVILGPGEGVRNSGNYTLTITISAQITTPQGTPVESLSLTLSHSFTVP